MLSALSGHKKLYQQLHADYILISIYLIEARCTEVAFREQRRLIEEYSNI